MDDHWICERCECQRAGTRKSNLRHVPDLVMIQLKRFQYLESGHRQKVRTLVDFPLTGLDFTRWIGNGNAGGTKTASSVNEHNIYDLYAVVNHVGGLARGHYTAYCRYDADFEESAHVFDAPTPRRDSALPLPLEDLWYRFDDEKVVQIAAGDVVSDAAYVLFYKRRYLSPHNLLAYAW